jgi:hypothetical protein
MSARVDSGIVRSKRFSASWPRAGSLALIRTWVGWASSSSNPVTYSATSPNVVGLPPTPGSRCTDRSAPSTWP